MMRILLLLVMVAISLQLNHANVWAEPLDGSASSRSQVTGFLVVRFSEGEIPENIVTVVGALTDAKLVDVKSQIVTPGDTYCSIFWLSVGLENKFRCPQGTIALGEKLNPNIPDLSKLSPGQMVKVPARVPIVGKSVTQRYDLSNIEDEERLKADRGRWNSSPPIVAARTASLKSQQYEISLATSKATVAAGLAESIQSAGPRGTYASFVNLNDARPTSKPHSTNQFTVSAQNDCSLGKLNTVERAYTRLLSSRAMPACARSCTMESRCPQVVMLDTQVVGHNAILPALLPSSEHRKSSRAVGPEKCSIVPFDRAVHHGTHLVGIVASQGTGSGFVGVSPAAKILAKDFERLRDEPVLSDFIETLNDEASDYTQIVLFANQFGEFHSSLLNEKKQVLRDSQFRFDKKLPSRGVQNQPTILWVVSAGQQSVSPTGDPIGDPENISDISPMSPQNLGDLANVIVVAACSDCSDRKAAISEWSNRSSSGFVHVAAPGLDLPGLVDNDEVAIASGTSQAAAFVAGVAAQMASCSSKRLGAGQLKVRIQLTSRPVLDASSRKFVVAGVVDPELAVMDQTKAWLKRFGQAFQEIKDVQWCVDAIQLSDPLAGMAQYSVEQGYFNAAEILRIARNRRIASGEPASWIVMSKPRHRSAIRVSPPGVWARDRRLLQFAGGTVSLGDIEELLLPKAAKVGKCS